MGLVPFALVLEMFSWTVGMILDHLEFYVTGEAKECHQHLGKPQHWRGRGAGPGKMWSCCLDPLGYLLPLSMCCVFIFPLQGFAVVPDSAWDPHLASGTSCLCLLPLQAAEGLSGSAVGKESHWLVWHKTWPGDALGLTGEGLMLPWH